MSDALLARFARLAGRPAAQPVSAHRWRFADTESSPDRNCCWDEDARIGLCGDWLNGSNARWKAPGLSGRGWPPDRRRGLRQA